MRPLTPRPLTPIFDNKKRIGALDPGKTPLGELTVLTGLYRGIRLDGNATAINYFSCGPVGGAADFTDTFNRANSTNLGADWSEAEIYAENLDISSNTLRARNTIAGGGTARYVVPAAGLSQFAEIEVSATNAFNGSHGMYLRSGSPLQLAGPHLSGGWQWSPSLQYFVSSTSGASGVSASAIPAVGTILRLEADGNTYRLYVNGVLTITVTEP